ncbi:hypothetical protein E2C01_086775 [Portunus trituberculatus]|uniref:Uncharacterized protein n=1 Tax=Portunus trituberculatus TaxID=210409 RepID=A0A5B7JA72_PORTR|nr:hypothetical protein [Portunus trituberculatus]
MKQNSNITKFRIHLSADKPQAVTGKVTYGASGGRTSSAELLPRRGQASAPPRGTAIRNNHARIINHSGLTKQVPDSAGRHRDTHTAALSSANA